MEAVEGLLRRRVRRGRRRGCGRGVPDGEEASFFCLCDGKTALPFGTAQDHKRVGEGDTGPNTGGMGAYSPAPVMTAAMIERTMREIIEPTMRGMAELGAPFSGVLFAGLMITAERPEADRIQCPLRRSRMPGADDAAEGRSARAAQRGRRRPAGPYSARWRDDAALRW